MSLWRKFRLNPASRQKIPAAESERNCKLQVFCGDARCELVVLAPADVELARIVEQSDQPAADPSTLISNALLRLPAEFEARIGEVAIFMDDPEIAIVDSRQAKLTHFEGRALSEFGKYQLGGKPTAFASIAYGPKIQAEGERRVVSYLSEDKLSAALFALGKLARYVTFFGPWSLQDCVDGAEDAVAALAVHGRFSTLTLANKAAGTVAVRQIPLGTSHLVEAYGEAFGLSFQDAAQALKSKPRLALDGAGAGPLTASRSALVPRLDNIAGEFAATADYFEFQRLSGRAAALSLSVMGHEIAGFAAWLRAILEIDIEPTAPKASAAPVQSLNFLEGARNGLLKLGNQMYDFAGGRFVPSKVTAETSALSPFAAKSGADFMKSMTKLSAQPVSAASLGRFLPIVGAVAAGAVALFCVYTFLLQPREYTLQSSTAGYRAALAQTPSDKTRANIPSAEPVAWAKDIITLASVMAYDMKLTRLTLTAAKPGTPAELQITGSLPQESSESISLVGKFLAHLSANRSLKRRLSEITFQGADRADKGDGAVQFHLNAKVTGGGP